MAKYCVLPGQEPVRLASLSGHVVIIGEEPREIPEMFHAEARAAGCMSDDELELLKKRLLGGLTDGQQQSLTGGSSGGSPAPAPSGTDDSFPPPPGGDQQTNDIDRAEKIKAAVIELINAGNPNDFTGNGSPKVESLKEKLGFEVTGPERDAAYEAAKG